MITQQLSFSILTAPLAAIDRRALSQAWYSALHLAHASNAPSSCGNASFKSVSREREQRHFDESSHLIRAREGRPARPRRPSMPPRALEPQERRAERSPLARRIERTFLDPLRPVGRATFTLSGTQARVHIALQSTTAGTRLVAVCPAGVRAGVARALNEARYALAVRGIALRVDVNEA